jgi:hypothetical protein
VTHRQSTLAHEAGHVVGGLLAGHRIKWVSIGASKRRPNDAGSTQFDFGDSPDLYGHLVAVVIGPMAAGEPPLPWPPHPDPYWTDAFTAATLVNHLGLSKERYVAAVALAAHYLDDHRVKCAIARVADALGQTGELDDRGVRDALGSELVNWLAQKGDA